MGATLLGRSRGGHEFFPSSIDRNSGIGLAAAPPRMEGECVASRENNVIRTHSKAQCSHASAIDRSKKREPLERTFPLRPLAPSRINPMNLPTPTERLKTEVATEIQKGVDLARSHGPLRLGKGMVSGMLALVLANFCLLAVLMFQFPTYLSTPKVREFLSFDTMRMVLLAANGGIILIRNDSSGFRVIHHSSGVDFAAAISLGDGSFLLSGEEGVHTYPATDMGGDVNE